MKKLVKVYNRTARPLEAVEDGQRWQIPPGYKLVDGQPVGLGEGGQPAYTVLPYFVAEKAIKQNVLLGTRDPLVPSNFESLIAVPEFNNQFNDTSYTEQSDVLEDMDRSKLALPPNSEALLVPRGGPQPKVPGRDSTQRGVKRAAFGKPFRTAEACTLAERRGD